MTDLGTLGGNVSMAYSINDSGVVVGEASTASGEMHAFVWQNGIMKDLGVVGETSSARGINSKGDIVGVAYAKNVRGGAVLWSGGQRQSLGDLGPSGSGSTGISINDNGQIAGVSSGFATNQGVVRAVVWLNGVITDLGTLGGLHSTATAIDAQGLVVGWAEVADSSTAAFQWQNGKMTQLASLRGGLTSAGTGTQAMAVNDVGQIVGSSVTSSGVTHAVIWRNGKIADLNSLTLQGSGLTLTRATGINGAGQIVVEQQTNLDGPTTRAFLLTPKQR
jgi:probable HAF family extracellular repeat protein